MSIPWKEARSIWLGCFVHPLPSPDAPCRLWRGLRRRPNPWKRQTFWAEGSSGCHKRWSGLAGGDASRQQRNLWGNIFVNLIVQDSNKNMKKHVVVSERTWAVTLFEMSRVGWMCHEDVFLGYPQFWDQVVHQAVAVLWHHARFFLRIWLETGQVKNSILSNLSYVIKIQKPLLQCSGYFLSRC